MSQLFKNQTAQFLITILLGLLAIFPAYHIFFLEKNVKSLQVALLANTSLIEVEQSIAQNIKILYKDQVITNLSVIQLSLENTGNQAAECVKHRETTLIRNLR